MREGSNPFIPTKENAGRVAGIFFGVAYIQLKVKAPLRPKTGWR